MLMVSWMDHESPDTVSAGRKLIVVTQQFFVLLIFLVAVHLRRHFEGILVFGLDV